MVWDVKDSLAADTGAPYRARICHAGREICAPAARGRDRAGSRDGMPPHGGFAIGLERITACFLGIGIANVKECSMFPCDINRVAP